jgi:NAD(P) transhydrogenase
VASDAWLKMQQLNDGCFMSDYDYELVVIGGGPAGEKGAAQAAYFGHKTIVIEAYRELGGACINWGTLAGC